MVSWFDIIEPRRAVASVPRKAKSERDVAFGAWRDMVDEPEKYGSDLENEWLALDAELRAGSGHWRLEAHWLSKEAELEEALANAQLTWRDIFTRVARLAAQKGEREWFRRDVHRILKANRKAARKQVKKTNKAATKIQAAFRGHLMRTKLNFLDCCMCLAHTVCPLDTEVGMMCRACAEQGPHEDITGCDDPWNWFRADYVDQTLPMLEEPRPATGMGGCLFCRKDGYKGQNTENDPFFCGVACQTKYDRWVDSQYNPRVPQYPFYPLTKRVCEACNMCDSAPATERISGVLYCDNCLDDQETCRECRSLFLKGTGPGMGFCDNDCRRY